MWISNQIGLGLSVPDDTHGRDNILLIYYLEISKCMRILIKLYNLHVYPSKYVNCINKVI